jgi:hypothetical protein
MDHITLNLHRLARETRARFFNVHDLPVLDAHTGPHAGLHAGLDRDENIEALMSKADDPLVWYVAGCLADVFWAAAAGPLREEFTATARDAGEVKELEDRLAQNRDWSWVVDQGSQGQYPGWVGMVIHASIRPDLPEFDLGTPGFADFMVFAHWMDRLGVTPSGRKLPARFAGCAAWRKAGNMAISHELARLRDAGDFYIFGGPDGT